MNDHGEVDLEPVNADILNADESAEVVRMTTYRWDFCTSATSSDDSRLTASERRDASADTALVDPRPARSPERLTLLIDGRPPRRQQRRRLTPWRGKLSNLLFRPSDRE